MHCNGKYSLNCQKACTWNVWKMALKTAGECWDTISTRHYLISLSHIDWLAGQQYESADWQNVQLIVNVFTCLSKYFCFAPPTRSVNLQYNIALRTVHCAILHSIGNSCFARFDWLFQAIWWWGDAALCENCTILNPTSFAFSPPQKYLTPQNMYKLVRTSNLIKFSHFVGKYFQRFPYLCKFSFYIFFGARSTILMFVQLRLFTFCQIARYMTINFLSCPMWGRDLSKVWHTGGKWNFH